MSIDRQDQEKFAAAVLDLDDLLDNAIDWIVGNLQPDEVFDTSDLRNYVAMAYSPEDVFSISDLETWAIDNGFVKENS